MPIQRRFKKDSHKKDSFNARPGNTNTVQHHFTRAQAALERGLAIIPESSPLHAVVAERREQIFADKGGKDNLSQLQLDQIEQYLTTHLLLSSVDAYLVGMLHPKVAQTTGRALKPIGIVNRRTHKVKPIVEQRCRLVETSLKLANSLGLKRETRLVTEPCLVCGGRSVDYVCLGCGRNVVQCSCPGPTEDSVSDEPGTEPAEGENAAPESSWQGNDGIPDDKEAA